jgi:hypothetical protein
MDDSEADLSKLVHQLARGVPNLELDGDVVKSQISAFKITEASILKKLGAKHETKTVTEKSEESPVARLVEEMKALPSRVAERLAESGDRTGRRKFRRIHPEMIMDMMHSIGDPSDPVGILMAASLIRDDVPWLYELAMEVYRTIKSGDVEAMDYEISRLRRFSEIGLRGSWMEDIGFGGKESYVLSLEFPRLLEQMLVRSLSVKTKVKRTAR